MAWGKGHKFRAKAVTIGGMSFPSQLEGSVYQMLLLRERAGEIRNIQQQAAVRLKEKCKECGEGPVVYKVDFSAEDCKTGETFYIEAKGVVTPPFAKRRRLWKANPPAKLEIWTGSWRNPKLTEVIEP